MIFRSDEKKRFLTFNFACFVACFRFRKDGPELLVVLYQDGGKYSVRLPGGCVRFEDIILGVKQSIPKMSPKTAERIPNILDRIAEWGVEHDAKITELEIQHEKDLQEIDLADLPKDKKNLQIKEIMKLHFREKNYLFNERMKDSFLIILYALENQTLINDILDKIRLACIERELNFEVFAERGADFYEAPSTFCGTHEKLGYVSMNVKAPDSSTGSGDTDILGSEWMPLKKAMDQLFSANQSSHQAVLQSAMREAIKRKLENFEGLMPYFTATDPV